MVSKTLLLLDTHAWVWLMEGSSRLSNSKALPQVEQAAHYNQLRVSIISVWEVAMLESKKRLRFTVPCLEWIQRSLRAPGLSLLPLLPEIVVESTRLPGEFHGDPADRLITSTARRHAAVVVTRDQ